MSEQLPPPGYQPPPAPPTGPPVYPPAGLPAFQPQGPGWNGPQPSNTMAIVALVLAIIPAVVTWIVSIVLGCIVLVRVSKGEARGRGMAITALIISTLWIALAVVVIAVGVQKDKKQDENRDAGSREISVTKARVGDCLTSIPGSTSVSTIDIVRCSSTHRGEVFATFDLDVADNASQDEIDRLAEGGCVSRFPAYVGISYSASDLDVAYLRPLKGSVAADSGVACILATDRTSTGSLKGSKR